jgi:hypothetical protein
MKIFGLLIVLMLNPIGFLNNIYCQDCSDFYKSKNCRAENSEGFKLSSLSRKYFLKVGTSVTYEVVFYGGNEIIIKCCTEDDFYPVRFKIKSSENGKVIYDNKYNNYIDNLNLLLDHTEPMAVEISIEPKNKNVKKTKDGRVCIGMAIYMQETYKNAS